MLKKAFVRVDISNAIGTGHFRRMTNLEKYLKSAFNITYIVKTDNPSNKIFEGRDVAFIDKESDFFDLIKTNKEYSVVIFDQLEYNSGTFVAVKNISEEITVVAFYENTLFDYTADLLVNYNLFDGWERYNDDHKLLCGPKYLILNDTIEAYRLKHKDSRRVFVSFGGSDPCNFTQKFINFVSSKNFDFEFNIHIGAMYEHQIEDDKNKNIILHSGEVDFFSIMSSCLRCVVSGGNTMYEAQYLGLSICILAQNEHQGEFARNLAKDYNHFYAGIGDEVDWSIVNDFLNLNEEYKIQNNTFDCLGVKRIAEQILMVAS